MSEKNKLKILCLHGCRQNGESFRQKLGSFRKNLTKLADFEFVEAPHSITAPPPYGGDVTVEKDPRTWWYSSPDGSYVSATPSDYDKGFEESLELVTSRCTETSYDGLMGFSMGACLSTIVASLSQQGAFPGPFKFLILVSGFKSLCSPHEKFYQSKIEIPTLHVIGDTDNMISRERSELFMSLFTNIEVLHHPGGHYIPASKEYKQTYIDFLKKFM